MPNTATAPVQTHSSAQKDFKLRFFTDETALEELSSALRKKWEWVVARSNKNALWYAFIICNLQQSGGVPKDASMHSVREMITSGIKGSAFERLKMLTQVSKEELGSVVNISRRTLARREVFHADESERIVRVAAAFQRTIEVFEDLEKARKWFSSPKRALGNKTPLQFCDTEFGADEVINLLGRIEHGVFS